MIYRLMRHAVGSDNLARVLHLAATRTIVYRTPRAVPQRARIDLDCADNRLVQTKRSGLQVIHRGLQRGPGLSSGLQRRLCVAKGSWGLKLVWGLVQRVGGRLPAPGKIERQNVTLARSIDIAVLMSCGSSCPMKISRMESGVRLIGGKAIAGIVCMCRAT